MRQHSVYQDNRYPSPMVRALTEFRAHPVYMSATYILLALVIIAAAAPLLAPYHPEKQFHDLLLQPPSWNEAGSVAFLFGTDDLGRDLFSRLIYGSRYSFGAALLVTIVAAIVGITIGAVAGMTRGIKSSVLNHVLDPILSIPSLLLAIIFVAIFGPGLQQVLYAILLVLVPQFIREVNNTVHDELQQPYVTAARLDGAESLFIFFRHILPNIQDRLLVLFISATSTAVLDITALGFLKLGAQAPLSEWGTMISGGLDLMFRAPWNVALPGLAIFITVISISIVAEGLRNSLRRLHQP